MAETSNLASHAQIPAQKDKKKKKTQDSWALVAHTSNSSYSVSRDQEEDRSWKPALGK
jgi:hypothetical protein